MFIHFFKKHKGNLLTFLLTTLLVFLFFYPTLRLGFFSDDYHFLYTTATQSSVFKYLLLNNIGEFNGHYPYGPILNFIYTFEYHLFALNAFCYHLIILLVYSTTAFFLFLFVKNISKNKIIAWASVLLFIFLQNHTSTLTWVAVQPHLFATFFLAVFLYLYHRFLVSKNNWFYIISLISIIFSIFTKESAITFPALLVLLELFFGDNKEIKKSIWRIFKRSLPFLAILAIYLTIRYSVLGYILGYYGSDHLSFQILPKLKMFVEIALSMFVSSPYRQFFSTFLLNHLFLTGFLVVALLIIVAYFSKIRGTKILWFSLFSFVLSTLPFLNVRFDAYSDEGERYSYLPSIFFVIFLASFLWFLLEKLPKKKFVFGFFIVVLLSSSTFFNLKKFELWKMSATIRENILADFSSNLDKQENNYFILLGLPNDFSGAQLTRNASLEMFKLENDFFDMAGDRVAMYTLPQKENFGNKLVELEQENADSFSFSILLPGNDFTGIENYENDFAKFTLENYNKVISKGKTIKVNLKKENIENSDYNIKLVYFDGQHLQFLDLN